MNKIDIKKLGFDDDSQWETIVDFTEIDPDGVCIEKVIEALEKLIKFDENAHVCYPKNQ